MLHHEELFTRSECCNCRQEIPSVGIECVECLGGKFRICLDCFSLGAEIGQHKRDHRYRFFDCGSLSMFPASPAELVSSKENNGSNNGSRWTAKEEIRLLDAIEQYGFGNWHDTSKHVESKSAAEAKEEFVKRYVNGSVGQVSWANKGAGEQVDPDFKKRFPQPIDHTCPPDDGPLSPSLTQRLPPLDISQDEINQLGYMPFRDDYEKEYDNEAEKLVAQLSFSQDDDEVDVGLKLALVDMYSRRLRERARRKRVIRDYQLVSKFFKKDRARSGDAAAPQTNGNGTKRFAVFEKKIQDNLRPFAQFYNGREFDHLIRNMIKEKDLKFRIRELLKYRAAGITRVDECVEYEKTRAGPSKRILGSVEEEGEEDRSFQKQTTQSPVLIQQLLQQNTGSTPLRRQQQEKDGSAVDNAFANQNLTPQQYYKDDCNSKNSESNVLGAASLPQILEKGMDHLPQLPLVLPGENSFPLNEKQRGMDDPSTAKMPPFASSDSDLLTFEELQICCSILLAPDQYLAVKTAFYLGKLQTIPTSQDENLFLSHGITSEDWLKLINFFKSSEQSSN